MVKQILVAAAVLMLVAAQNPRSDSKVDPVIARCTMTAIQNQAVPASDPGVLLEVMVREGQHVIKDMELARVDSREAQALTDVREAELDVAKVKASSDVEIRHAKKAADVAKSAYDKLMRANVGAPGAVADIDVQNKKFEWERAVLGIESKEEDMIQNRATLKAKAAEVRHAKVSLDRRTLRAPYDGEVVYILKHPGEWVSPGDMVMEIVRTDKLRVSGDLDATVYSPADAKNRSVTVVADLPGGKTISIDGRVMFVSPVVKTDQKFEVWAEIDAPMVDGSPVVRDGMSAKMTIHVSRPPASEGPATATRPSGKN